MTARVLKAGRLPWRDESLPANGVVSVREMRRSGLLSAMLLKKLQTSTGLGVSRLDTMYLHASHLGEYDASIGDSGGMVLYRVTQPNGRLQTVAQRPSKTAATSWAAPESLSRAVNDALRAH